MNGMTGYSSLELDLEEANLITEIKTVNHRFLDINLYIPPYLNFLEVGIRNLIKERLKRGKVDIYISLKVNKSRNIEPNLNAAGHYVEALREIITHFDLKDELKLFHLTRFDDILQTKQKIDYSTFWEHIEGSLNRNLDELCEMRKLEGTKTKENLLAIIADITANLTVISRNADIIEKEIFNNIKETLSNLISENVDEGRIATEAAIMVNKSCINEEIERLKHHIEHFNKLANQNEEVGKKLDFICQEMHREINTIGSKITLSELYENVINIKNNIEKLREQIRNIE